MNESIIRRFARYLGLVLLMPDEDVATGHGALVIASMFYGSEAPENIIKVAQRIARIEDAEMLLARVESFSVPLLATNQEAKALREVYAFDAARLLVMAGIDPAKWREVKE